MITLPAIPLALGVGLAGLNPLVPVGALPGAILAAVLIPGILFAVAIPFGAGAIGMGDLKLLVSVGLLTGLARSVSGVVVGALVAGLVLMLLVAARRITLRTLRSLRAVPDHRRVLGGPGHPLTRSSGVFVRRAWGRMAAAGSSRGVPLRTATHRREGHRQGAPGTAPNGAPLAR